MNYVSHRTDGPARLALEYSLLGGQQMQEYRAYILGPDGHIQNRVDLICPNEDRAMERAKQLLVDGHDVELWQLDRMIATFPREQ